MYRCFLIGFLLFNAFAVKAQVMDTTGKKNEVPPVIQARRDSMKANPVPKSKVKVYYPDTNHSPRTAVMRSLMVPGWGQIYNRKWWKVPAVYTGLGLLAWAYVFNVNYFNESTAVAKYRVSGEPPNPGDPYYQTYIDYQPYTTAAINDAIIGARRNRDLSAFGFVGVWAIQMVDAYIDAKYKHSYDMNDKLSIKIKPGLLNTPIYAGSFNNSIIPGLKITFTLN
ncbi:hypothetical protein GCM10027049_04440 [Mucilaginibacter puniceus]